ncbi:MAG: peroxiredoxin [Calditrichaeota bacterium]|nr:peroxiredoxin [Calditrichota bacterium]
MLQIGSKAPDFTAEAVWPDGAFKPVKLADYAGKWLALFFYPLDFTFVCPTEITGFAKRLSEFKELNAEVLGGSVDSVYCHLAWIKSDLGNLGYPLFSDISHTISAQYGVLLEDKGFTLRGLFIIDPKGVIRYQLVQDNNIGRSVDETLRALCALQTGERCPSDWKKGQPTLGK